MQTVMNLSTRLMLSRNTIFGTLTMPEGLKNLLDVVLANLLDIDTLS